MQRGTILEGGRRALGAAGTALKGRLAVTFTDAQGLGEAGLDHGGLTKELLEEASTSIPQT